MSDATLFLAIKEGGAEIGMRPAMPAFGARLSNDEIAALVHLVRSFCAPPEPLAPSDPGATTPPLTPGLPPGALAIRR